MAQPPFPSRLARMLKEHFLSVIDPPPVELERDESRKNWLLLRTFISARRATQRPLDPIEREAFELLRAAVLYQFDAKHGFGGGIYHEKWRLPWRLVSEDYLEQFMDLEEPYMSLLETSTSTNESVFQMHLASAAVRIPVALQKVIECRPPAATPFLSPIPHWNLQRRDWDRGKMKARFDAVKSLGHCKDGPLGATFDEGLQNAITIIFALRDEFGHGEAGDPKPGAGRELNEYIEGRRGVVDEVHTCRVVQAQEQLLKWGAERLCEG